MIIFIVGPTAVGKTQVALDLARHIKGEIICCDAMQVYQEIEIASDKPKLAIRQEIPHHLFDIVSVQQPFNVFLYVQQAMPVIQHLLSSGKIPIICGGSGMYMAGLLDGIFQSEAIPSEIRQRLEQEAQEDLNKLYARLTLVDPKSASRIKDNDPQRIIRALEVFEGLGRPISDLQKDRKGLWGQQEIRIFGLQRSREILYQRVEKRIDKMFQQGLVAEVEAILKKKLTDTASKLIGIPEVKGYLEGQYSLERAQYLMKLHTRHYVKRQLTWFNRENRLQWISIEEQQSSQQIVECIQNQLQKRTNI